MHPSRLKELALTGGSLLRFHALGAAEAVTGSLFLYEYFYGDKVFRTLLDCGSTVENPAADLVKRLPTGVNASDIDAIIISHAHADHCGYLPALIKQGFKGKVFCTPASRDLMALILPDSGHLQEEQAKRANRSIERRFQKRVQDSAKKALTAKKGKGKGKPDQMVRTPRRVEALYTEVDAKAALSTLVPVEYHVRRRVNPEVAFTFSDAGHILGAAVVNMEFGSGANKRTVCFTGNVGRRNMPLLRDLEVVKDADYLVLEATYGNKLHLKRDRLSALADVLNAAYKRAKRRDPKYGCGVILVPSFAVGRAQTFLNDYRILVETKRIPNMAIFADGNMLNAATEVYKKHAPIMNDETRKLLEAGKDPYAAPRHLVVKDWKVSERLHAPAQEPVVIVASSGMASGGRVINHLKHWLPGSQNTVLFIGHQGEGTLGETLTRTIKLDAEGKPNPNYRPQELVKVAGEVCRVGATIALMPDYSAHGDYEDQIAWMRNFKRAPKRVFIVHGDVDSLIGFKGHIEKSLGWKRVSIPTHKQVFEL